MERVLVICDDLWHPAEVIELGLKNLEGKGYEFDVIKAAKDILTLEKLAAYPVVICCKCNNVIAANPEPWFEDTVTEVGPTEFRTYIENGGGFIAVHSANTFMEKYCRKEERFQKPCREFNELVGNRFLGHPLRCPVEVQITNPSHPVADGVTGFIARDEHYQLTDIAEDADIFLKTISVPGGIQVGGYTREIGKGRLCVLTPGHTLEVWEKESFIHLLLNAVTWCCQK